MPDPGGYAYRMAKPRMRGVVESIIGTNLDALMAHHSELNNSERVGSKAKIPPRTVNRIKNAQVSCTVDTLAKIAKVFEIEPWALLVPNYDPANPPVRTMTQDERNFYARMRADLQNLPAEPDPAPARRPARART